MWSWPLPESRCSWLSGSRPAWRARSSSISRCRASPIFSSSPFDLGSTAKAMAGSGTLIQASLTGWSLAHRVSPVTVDLELGDAADVAGDQARHVASLLALERHQVAEPLGLLGAAVLRRGVGVERAGDDAQQRDLAGEGVGEGLEDQRRERPRRDRPASAIASPPTFCRREGGAVGGRGEQGEDGVEQRRRADAVAAAADERQREDLPAGDGAAQPGHQILLRDRAVLEEALHQLVVGLGHRLDEPARGGLSTSSGELGGISAGVGLAVAVAGEAVGLLVHQVDDAGEAGLLADRDLDRQHPAAEPLLQPLEGAAEVGPLAVHLGEVDHHRQPDLGGGLPDLLGVDLDAGDAVDAEQRRRRRRAGPAGSR